uniref:Uncharacterized protein n=1 Tax=viral metagenome TaxID=1070528 RepID=A0A6M3M293_9ZZZZ
MKIFTGPEIPTPFGVIKLPDAETPPLKLPAMPDARATKAIGHGLGEDAAQIVGLIPWIGDIIEDALEDSHHVEIKKLLNPDEYRRYAEYNKSMPTTVALVRTLCFKEV